MATETVVKSPEQAEGSKSKKRLCKTDEKYLEDITEDSKQMQTEKERVASLLKKMKKVSKTESATETVTKPYLGSVHSEYDQPVGAVLKELFDGVYSRLDGMNSLLQQQTKSLAAIMVPKQTSSATNGLSGYQRPTAPATHTVKVGLPATPLLIDSGSVGDLPAKTPVKAGPADPASPLQVNHEAFVVNGINLLTDVPAKARKPKLYATSLLSVLFTDKEMRNGSVEPKEGTTTKVALNSTKINLIKKCIMVKFGEKVVEKSWAEIRTSLNQKCLDKLKAFRKLNMTLTHAAQTNGAQSETDEAQTLDDHEDMDV